MLVWRQKSFFFLRCIDIILNPVIEKNLYFYSHQVCHHDATQKSDDLDWNVHGIDDDGKDNKRQQVTSILKDHTSCFPSKSSQTKTKVNSYRITREQRKVKFHTLHKNTNVYTDTHWKAGPTIECWQFITEFSLCDPFLLDMEKENMHSCGYFCWHLRIFNELVLEHGE